MLWRETNQLMYADDAAPGRSRGTLAAELVRELATSSSLRPAIPDRLVAELEAKLQRTAPGWSPGTADELVDWAAERLLVPPAEWDRLLDAMARDHGGEAAAAIAGAGRRLLTLSRRGGHGPAGVVHVETVPRIVRALGLARADLQLGPLDTTAPDCEREVLDALRRLLPEGEAGFTEEDATQLVAEWLRCVGPVLPSDLARVLGLEDAALAGILDLLAAEGQVVVDTLTVGAPSSQVCERDNLERLLRMLRASQRPTLEVKPAELLPLFLADHQRLGVRNATPEDLRAALEPLLGAVVPAGLWETEVLPARVDPYLPAWLDGLLAETDLEWFGAGEGRIAFTLDGERELVAEPAGDDGQSRSSESLFPHPLGRFTLEELATHRGEPAAAVTLRLWQEAWCGQLSADGFAAVRRGVAARFRPSPIRQEQLTRGSLRAARDRWRSSRSFGASWYRLPPIDAPEDPLEAEERDRERVRLLLDRYGVLFRSLLEREPDGLGWRSLFRSLRLLELAGEVVSGRFFEGVAGLQFASPAAIRRLIAGLPEDRVWWLNAADPASPAGLGLPLELPRRVATSHLVFHGCRLVVVSHANGRRLEIRVAPDHPELHRYLGLLKVWLGRDERPLRSVTVETVNGEPAAEGPYRKALTAVAHTVRSGGGLRLSRRY